MDKFKILPKSKIDLLPKTTGVYLFYSKKLNPKPYTLKPIYIGKAINIKNRAQSHFKKSNYKDNLFIDTVNKIGFHETNSEIEALILEANLIKKYQPKYNVVWKDDKNYFWVAFENNKNAVPFVYVTHQTTNFQFSIFNFQSNSNFSKPKKIYYIGPFTDGKALKKTLKFLRRVFPYYTLRSGSGQAAKHPKNKCTWCHLDLCPGPDPDLPKYKRNIKKLVLILKGKGKAVLNLLKKEMKQESKNQNFEKAGKIRDQIYALQQIMAHTQVIESSKPKNPGELLAKIIGSKKPVNKIECYDVSNIQGKQATGSMAVFINGKPDKNQYRKFKIRLTEEPNDIAMLKEVIGRRLKHLEWKYPDTMLIDGGKAQLNAAITCKAKTKKAKNIKIISIAKGKQELFIENKKTPIPLKSLSQQVYNLIKHLDEEAHRFAISYHKKIRSRELLN